MQKDTPQEKVPYQVTARKYRPKDFHEVLGQDAIVQTLQNALKKESVAHAYIFSGSRGTGKTTLARILAKALNCTNLKNENPCSTCSSCIEIARSSSLDVLEIDGASNRGIDDIRKIASSIHYTPVASQYKIYIIDEVHMLTKEAFNALLKTLEEPPENVKFFFATTELHKVPQTIVSRCQRFTLRRIPEQLIVQKLQRICHDKSIQEEHEALTVIARYAQGGLRDAESLFDQIASFSNGNITKALVQDMLGLATDELFYSLDKACLEVDVAKAFIIAHTLFYEGKDISHFLQALFIHYKQMLLAKLGTHTLLEHLDERTKSYFIETSTSYTKEQLIDVLEEIQKIEEKIKHTLSEQTLLETLLVKIIQSRMHIPIPFLVRKLTEIESSFQKLLEAPVQNDPTETTYSPIQQKSNQPQEAITAPIQKKPPLNPPQEEKKVPLEKEHKKTQTTLLMQTEEKPTSNQNEPSKELIAQEKAKRDTLLQFAAVEFKGSIQKS